MTISNVYCHIWTIICVNMMYCIFPQLSVRCLKKNAAPYEMKRGSATTDGQFAYFTPGGSNSVYRYELNTEKWDQLPPSPYWNSGLVIINDELTAVGGEIKYRYTNKVFTLQQKQWVQHYPPMKIGRSESAVVSTSDPHYIFVIGGNNVFYAEPAAVEVLDVRNKRWYNLSNCKLPQDLFKPSATICGNQLYVMEEDGDGYTCSLQVLLSSIQPYSALHTWTKLPRLPIRLSTAATLCGELLVVSGVRHQGPSNLIYQLVDGRWVKIGSTSGGMTECLVVSPLPDKMIIVGGDGRKNSVEECVVV